MFRMFVNWMAVVVFIISSLTGCATTKKIYAYPTKTGNSLEEAVNDSNENEYPVSIMMVGVEWCQYCKITNEYWQGRNDLNAKFYVIDYDKMDDEERYTLNAMPMFTGFPTCIISKLDPQEGKHRARAIGSGLDQCTLAIDVYLHALNPSAPE